MLWFKKYVIILIVCFNLKSVPLFDSLAHLIKILNLRRVQLSDSLAFLIIILLYDLYFSLLYDITCVFPLQY